MKQYEVNIEMNNFEQINNEVKRNKFLKNNYSKLKDSKANNLSTWYKSFMILREYTNLY